MDLKKLSNQKGITGIDVVIALTIISITTLAIVALYTNIIVGSKKVTRTSAATRIATSILENIDSMYYAEVEQEIARLTNMRNPKDTTKAKYVTKQEDNSTNNYTQLTIFSSENETIFNSRINSGYDVVLDIKEIDGSIDGTLSECPLVIEVKVTVKYKVSNITEKITLKTIKKREMVEECNEPDLNLLLGKNISATQKIESLNQINPIKWSEDANAYIKTNISDGWYSYSNKEWAKVVIGNPFNSSTLEVQDLDTQKIFMWVPRFGKTVEETPEVAFAYKGSNDRIKEYEFFVNGSSTKTLTFNGIAFFTGTVLDKEKLEIPNDFKDNETGVWVDISGGTLKSLEYTDLVNSLNASKYGPTIPHKSNGYY